MGLRLGGHKGSTCLARHDVGVSENGGTLFGGPYDKDPTI